MKNKLTDQERLELYTKIDSILDKTIDLVDYLTTYIINPYIKQGVFNRNGNWNYKNVIVISSGFTDISKWYGDTPLHIVLKIIEECASEEWKWTVDHCIKENLK